MMRVVFESLGSYMYQIYLKEFYYARSCFSCENFAFYKKYPQRFRNVKVTFQQVSIAETVHTPSFRTDSAFWKYWQVSASFSRRKSSGIWDILVIRIEATCWNCWFQHWNYAETICNLKFQYSFSGISAMLKRYFSSSAYTFEPLTYILFPIKWNRCRLNVFFQ